MAKRNVTEMKVEDFNGNVAKLPLKRVSEKSFAGCDYRGCINVLEKAPITNEIEKKANPLFRSYNADVNGDEYTDITDVSVTAYSAQADNTFIVTEGTVMGTMEQYVVIRTESGTYLKMNISRTYLTIN